MSLIIKLEADSQGSELRFRVSEGVIRVLSLGPRREEVLDRLEKFGRGQGDEGELGEVGRAFEELLAEIGWESISQRIVEALHGQRQVRLDIVSDSARIHRLPWSLLPLRPGVPLYREPNCMVRARKPGPVQLAAPASPASQWRVLLAHAGVTPHAQVFDAMGHRGAVTRSIRAYSMQAIVDELRRARAAGEPYAVLHFLCHGRVNSHRAGLVLEDDEFVQADELSSRLSPFVPELRLVVLSACLGDAIQPGSQRPSTAMSLHAGTIGGGRLEAVIAWRFLLSFPGAIAWARAFYARLLSSTPSTTSAALEDAWLAGKGALAGFDQAGVRWFGRGPAAPVLAPATLPPAQPPALALGAPTVARELSRHLSEPELPPQTLDEICAVLGLAAGTNPSAVADAITQAQIGAGAEALQLLFPHIEDRKRRRTLADLVLPSTWVPHTVRAAILDGQGVPRQQFSTLGTRKLTARHLMQAALPTVPAHTVVRLGKLEGENLPDIAEEQLVQQIIASEYDEDELELEEGDVHEQIFELTRDASEGGYERPRYALYLNEAICQVYPKLAEDLLRKWSHVLFIVLVPAQEHLDPQTALSHHIDLPLEKTASTKYTNLVTRKF